jgi:hypothetical protein
MQQAKKGPDDFWNQVIEERSLSPDLVENYRRSRSDTSRVPLGRILIRERVLSVRQVMTLVSMQIEEPDVLIGDLAVREGFCTKEAIDQCLDVQLATCSASVEDLLQDGNVSEPLLVHALVGYLRFLEQQLEIKNDERGLLGVG